MKTQGTIKIINPATGAIINLHTITDGQTIKLAEQVLQLPSTLIWIAQLKYYADRGLSFYKLMVNGKHSNFMSSYEQFIDAWESGLYLGIFPESLASLLIMQNTQLFAVPENGTENWTIDKPQVEIIIENKHIPNLTITLPELKQFTINTEQLLQTWEELVKTIDTINNSVVNEKAKITFTSDMTITFNLDMITADLAWQLVNKLP